MPRFQPSLAYWPWPQFLGNSQRGFAEWIIARDRERAVITTPMRAHAIRRGVEDHHDRHARTVVPAR